jgi:anti-sigma regulatory factor (Ser/Thr protein kinase)
MSELPWRRQPLPQADPARSRVWQGSPTTPADLTALRGRLRAGVLSGEEPYGATEEDLERLLLIVEELGSNGLRHGRPPVEVTVTEIATGWLVQVCDRAVDRPPAPAVGRDAAHGGLGLYLVARLCAAHGWDVSGGLKYVWGRVEIAAA